VLRRSAYTRDRRAWHCDRPGRRARGPARPDRCRLVQPTLARRARPTSRSGTDSLAGWRGAMSLDLFGYNGVFELDQDVVNEVLSTFLYEQHLVPINGQVTDGDFFSVPVTLTDREVHIYFELAAPYVHVQTNDGTNLVTLHIPLSKFAIFDVP